MFNNLKKSHGVFTVFLQYFTDNYQDYWHILFPLILWEERENNKMLYFWDTSRKATGYNGQFSDDGIYQFKGYDKKYHVHALEGAQYSLACWSAWNNNNEEKWKNQALIHCDWLLNTQMPDGAWRTEHKNPKHNKMDSPWPSSLTQGFAISSLVRAYRYTKDEKYLAAAKAAVDYFQLDVRDGGVRREFDQGFILEEYPLPSLNGVLNGYISAILAIYEISELLSEYQELFTENLHNLKKILFLYDQNFWSLYDLAGNYASGFYHRFQTSQLKVLSNFDPYFLEIAERFESNIHNPLNSIRAILRKLTY